MSARLEELDWQETAMGELTLRRRNEPTLGIDIYEVKLGDEYLMSSLFTEAEEKLATLGLAATGDRESDPHPDSHPARHTDRGRKDGDGLDVLVGGLGLGYTAVAALADPRVRTLVVVEALPAVIDWHRRLLLPVSADLVGDSRTSLMQNDFFAVMRGAPHATYDAILLDVDHSPRHQLDRSHADLYEIAGLRALTRHLNFGGVFALWSDDPPDEEFLERLGEVFATHAAHVVDFDNPLTGGVSSNTVYVAR